MARDVKINELVVNTTVWDHTKRLRCYELLTPAFVLEGTPSQLTMLCILMILLDIAPCRN